MADSKDYEIIDKKLYDWLKKKGKQENKLYPEFYAGNSMDENDDITLYIKKGEFFDEKELLSYLEIDTIKLEEKKYSLNELEEFFQKIDLEDSILNFIDEDNNCIVLVKKEFTKEEVERLEKKYGKNEWLALMEGNLEEQVTAVPGQITVFLNNAQKYSATIGFNAVRCDDVNKKGVVSTTHGKNPDDMRLYDNATLSNIIAEISNIADIKYVAGIDAIFAERPIGNTNRYTNQIANTGITISGTERFQILHPTVHLYGATSGHQTGKIKTINGIYRGALEYYICTYNSDNGDSGAPVIHNTNIIGIHKAGGTVRNSRLSRCLCQPEQIYLTVVCKYHKIEEHLNVKFDLTP